VKKLVLILLVSLTFSLTACETMKGLGSDIQKAGKALEDKASD